MTSSTSSTPSSTACLADMSAASLFVGELLPHVNEVLLYKKFAPMGTVTSVKLCRDWITGKSLCYAYVNFENAAEAEKAYRTLNYELLEGQPMRILKSTRNPWLPNREDSNCCYHHHHHHCCGPNNKELIDPRTLVEAIESYSRAVKEAGENKSPTGYRYSKEFLKRMNVANKQFTNVFIKNFKDLLDDYKLYKLCKQFGEVTSAKVMLNEHGISKGFGFVCFRDSDAAQRAVNKLNGLVLDGRTLYAGPAMTRSQRQKESYYSRSDTEDFISQDSYHNSFSPRICIRNLRDIVDKIRLQKEFERFGPVVSAELMKNNDGRSRGTGYVLYEDTADAIKAVSSMSGKVIYGTRIIVTFAPYNNSKTAPGTSLTSIDDDLEPTCNSRATSHNRGDGDMGSRRSLGDLKDLANTLAQKGHPVNINDIGLFSTKSTVNRNYSNNSDINTSNNAIKSASAAARKDEVLTRDINKSKKEDGDGKDDTEDDIHDDRVETISTTATLSVKNLDESITDEKLESLFAIYGQVISAKVVSSEFGVSKGFGFVIMADMQDAVRAIKNLDGRIVVNRPVYIFLMTRTRSLTKV